MKKVIRTMVGVAMLFAATTVMANEPRLETDGISKSITFEWDASLENASLKIVDQEGYVIYADNVGDVNGYIKKFNMASLQEGTYLLSVENSLKEIVYSLRVNKNNVSIINVEESVKPFYKKEEGMVYLNLLNLDKEEVKVTVFDGNGRKLYKEIFADKSLIQKAFNFKNAFRGDYSIVVKNDGKTFYETISIK